MSRSVNSKKKANHNDDIPDMYRDMLADVKASSPALTDDEGKTVKRRRIGGRIVTKETDDMLEQPLEEKKARADIADEMDDLFEESVPRRPELVKTDSEDSTSSDMDWEEVDLQHQDVEKKHSDSDDGEAEGLDLVLEPGGEKAIRTPRITKRKPVTSVEKKLRLEIHKMNLCCLLVHVSLRNHWCNDRALHTRLRGILTKKTVSYLNPDEDLSQFQRSRSFMDGLEQASEAFRSRFKISARGLSRPVWAESSEALARFQIPTDIDLPMLKEDFRIAAQQLNASRDVGAQLLCALLRSVGVDTRLVCSLQILPYNSALPAITPPQAKYAAYYSAEQQEKLDIREAVNDSGKEDHHVSAGKSAFGSVGGRTRFESDAGDTAESSSTRLPLHPKRPIRESKYPVYWVESFNEAVQKWVPVDPLVTKTIAKTSKFEPPAGDQGNKMTYVIAFEDDGSARDVTRRYAKAYNAKTRRDRVESTARGDKWWKRVMKLYQRRRPLDRDQVDDAELAKKEAAEPMPRNVQDFKDHPYYALQRHLRRHEVIYPGREVGKISIGKSGGNSVLEPIFRRRDVHRVLSGDKWYRTMGREIKPGEQPLKRVAARRAREQSADANQEDDENAGTALYAIHQTRLYTAPPVVNGRIPRNVYGNIDVYVSTMIPSGGCHIEHPDTVRAAKILGIDFAEAVTGFLFKGRHGTAITKGAVIPSEYRDAVGEVVSALEDERVGAEEARRSHEALRMWKRFLTGLQIRERIEGYDIEGERDNVQDRRYQMAEEEEEHSNQGGGFFPEQQAGDIVTPTGGQNLEPQTTMDIDNAENDEYIVNNAVSEIQETERHAREHFLDNVDDNGGGGFFVEDDHNEYAEQALRDPMAVDADVQEPSPVPPSQQSPVSLPDARLFKAKHLEMSMEHKANRASGSADATAQDELAVHQTYFNSELTQAELDEAHLLQQLHEAEQQQQPSYDNKEEKASLAHSPPHVHINTSEPATDQREAVPNAADTAPSLTRSPTPVTPSKAPSPKSDKGSLLSEDPEDEDADPDWLV